MVEALEQQYIKDQNVTLEQNITSDEMGIDHSQVKVIGAALNAAGSRFHRFLQYRKAS